MPFWTSRQKGAMKRSMAISPIGRATTTVMMTARHLVATTEQLRGNVDEALLRLGHRRRRHRGLLRRHGHDDVAWRLPPAAVAGDGLDPRRRLGRRRAELPLHGRRIAVLGFAVR